MLLNAVCAKNKDYIYAHSRDKVLETPLLFQQSLNISIGQGEALALFRHIKLIWAELPTRP